MEAPIGFIGSSGIMGEGMCNCLLKEGRRLVIWNRNVAKSEAIAASQWGAKVTVAASASDVVAQCAVTYSMLSDLRASEAVFPAVLAASAPGKSLIDCATLTPERMAAMAAAFTAEGGAFLEAPVSGSKAPAAAGALIFLCGGDRAVYDAAKPELAIMGKADFHFGDVGKGTQMKLVVNMVMGDMMVALGEGLALAGAAGLPADAESGLLKVLDLGVMANGLFKLKGPKMLAGDHAPNFPLKHAQKDMRFAIALGDELGQALPAAAAANAAFVAARGANGDADFSAVYESQKPR